VSAPAVVESKLLEILRILTRHEIEFIVVGGMAAVIGGAPIVTRDVDVLRSTTKANVQRMLEALKELDAVFRGDSRRLRPNESHLEGPGHLLLETRYGVLDLLGTIEEATTYDDLLSHSSWVDLDGFAVRVLSLERLLEVKRKLDRPKDKLMVLQIEAVLDEQRRTKQ
jgi:predicted nucleotidyltransferase